MVYVIPIVKLPPALGLTLSAVTPDGGRETCQGCAAGTLLDMPDESLVTGGLAEQGPPRTGPSTDAERDAMIAGKDQWFIDACDLLGYL
jgi:hypothetical protein|tara:strand:+ start:2340 stop:2606 length:267 start_codon:yes stop_codon:yes gene_type:complete